MAQQKPQTREAHTRIHPPFQFFFLPAILLLILISAYEVIHQQTFASLVQLLLVLVVAVIGLLARTYALKVQDRVIRLEERQRLSALLPSDLRPAIYNLSERQLVALRFASDDELPALAQRALADNLDPKAIKSLIKNWRPDYWRV